MEKEGMSIEEKILKTLKDFGRKPTSQISSICGINFSRTFEKLNKLLKENKVIKQQETNSTYWEFKK